MPILLNADTYWSIAFVVFCSLWRPWLGGVPHDWPFERGLTGLKYFLWIAATAAYVFFHARCPDSYRIAASGTIAFFTWAMWRAVPQDLDSFPLGDHPKDPILKALGFTIANDQKPVDWWVYAFLRYLPFCIIMSFVAWYTRAPGWVYLVLPGYLIPVFYRLQWAWRDRLPHGVWRFFMSWSSTPDWNEADQAYHWAEIASGFIVGASVVAAYRFAW